MKKIGIVGGMGPEATATFYVDLVRECQRRFGAWNDCDYPEILIHSLALPDTLSNVDHPAVLPRLLSTTDALQNAGAECLAMPCCTLHVFADQFHAHASVPFISIVDEASKAAYAIGSKKVGVLGTSAAMQSRIFHDGFAKYGMDAVMINEQEAVSHVIKNVLRGNKLDADRDILCNVINQLAANGADSVVLGCTELPLIFRGCRASIPVVDSLDVLAKSVIDVSTL